MTSFDFTEGDLGEFIFYQTGVHHTIVVGNIKACCANCARAYGEKRWGTVQMAVVCRPSDESVDEFDMPGRCIRESNRLRWEAATGQTE